MDNNRKSNRTDDFWDISDLIPKRGATISYGRSVEAKEISIESKKQDVFDNKEKSDTVIVRYIDSRQDERLSQQKSVFESVDVYAPSSSLIHEVTLKKRKSEYRFYEEFLEDAIRLSTCRGAECEYVSFFSYAPQYNQLSDKQLSYYLWFRDCFLRGKKIRIDYSYILLLIYERINLGSLVDVKQSQTILTDLWYAYHREFPALSSKLAEWICDFSLVHRLYPPEKADEQLVHSVPSLKEYYLTMPDYDVDGCVGSLLKYCTSYDYHASKFATEENLPLFEQFIPKAVSKAVSFYSSEGKILSELSFEDSYLTRDAYAGALCVANERYRIEVRYCSFSRSNELRFLVGDVIKYAENKIRAYLGIKSKMTVYSIPTELQRILDEFFATNLSGRKTEKTKRAPEAYETLYEIPAKPLSLSDAARIERESWVTTEKLVTAFEEETEIPEQKEESVSVSENPDELSKYESLDFENELQVRLGEYLDTILDLCDGNTRAMHQLASKMGKMPESLVDQINEIAFDVYGDALLEECDGGYSVIEDYREYIGR